MTIKRIEPGPRMSEAVVYNGMVFIAGQVADDTTQDITGQTRQVLAQIDAILERAGSDKSRLLRTEIYLPDIGDFAAMNKVWEAWVTPGQTPARATVEAKLASPKYKVEIVVLAAAR